MCIRDSYYTELTPELLEDFLFDLSYNILGTNERIVERTCDRIGMIRNGTLAAVDSVETLRKRHMRTYSVHLDSPELAESFAKDFHGKCDGNTVSVTAKQSLETIFMNYYGGDKHA